jgi:CHAT domain-containing protein
MALSSKGASADVIDGLFSQKSQIESEISSFCSELDFSEDRGQIKVGDIVGALPDNSVFLDYVKYEYYDYEKHYPYGQDSMYAVIVYGSDKQVEIIGLGCSDEIDSLITAYHSVITDALARHLNGSSRQSITDYAGAANDLYGRLIVPLSSVLKSTEQVFIAADGMLDLLPFETLTKDGERYLIEDYRFVYLTSGRDLLKEKADLIGRDAFVMADPDYMIDPTVLPVLATAESSTGFAFRGNAESPECLGSMFSPLPMTRKEGTSVAGLLGETGQYDITYLESDQAREGVLKNLEQAPDILHIATHGYFCEQAENAYMSNPLLRSGLILAGANRTIGEMNEGSNLSEDGILTSMEVSSLNLIGTDLVVLSACQTGIGDVQSGEGVFGLRRAFQHAGAKSVIMSMFAVPDESTSDLMQRFYENWLSGQSKSSALRNASLSILNERRDNGSSTHPLFWGGFILVGDPD